MKTVWLLNHYAQEPGGPGGTRHYSLAAGLRRHGWDCHIIAASVELNTGRQRLAAHERRRIDRFGEVPFVWLRTNAYHGNGIGRVVNMLGYTIRAILPAGTAGLPRPDVVIGSSVHPLAAWAGLVLARRHGVPFVFEVRDLWPQTLIDLGRISASNPAAVALRWMEKHLYRAAARIIVLLPGAKDYITPLGIPPAKIAWIPNGVDLAAFPSPPPASDRVKFTLMYFGAHGTANGLDNVLEAMARLRLRRLARPVCLRLVGDGPLKRDLVAQAKRLGLDDVSFEPPVAKASIPALCAEADAFVFNLVDAPVFKYGISSNKLFDFLAGARPILFCSNASNNPVAEADAGMTVAPGDPQALAEAIAELVAMPLDRRLEMGRNGRRYVESRHGYEALSASLARLLDEVTAPAHALVEP